MAYPGGPLRVRYWQKSISCARPPVRPSHMCTQFWGPWVRSELRQIYLTLTPSLERNRGRLPCPGTRPTQMATLEDDVSHGHASSPLPEERCTSPSRPACSNCLLMPPWLLMSSLWCQPALNVPCFTVTLVCLPHCVPAGSTPPECTGVAQSAAVSTTCLDSVPQGSDSVGLQCGSASLTATLADYVAGGPGFKNASNHPARGKNHILEIFQENKNQMEYSGTLLVDV